MLHLNNLSIFPKMRKPQHRHKIFKLLWVMDLKSLSGSHDIKILFHCKDSNHYLTDSIAPEYLSYCSICSYFMNGRKLDIPADGEIFERTITLKERNDACTISRALSAREYNLNHGYRKKNADGSYESRDYSEWCRNQRCLVFQEGKDKIVIPCSVVAAAYYFTSASMRRQVLAQNLEGLYEFVGLNKETMDARILLKPNANDDDALNIARFALDSHAKKCWDLVIGSFRKLKSSPKKEKYCSYGPYVAHIPVVQDLFLKLRGVEAKNAVGGTTLIVFEILDESSYFPFGRLFVLRRKPNMSIEAQDRFVPQTEAQSDDEFVKGNPSRNYSHLQTIRPNPTINLNDSSIAVVKVLLPPRPAPPGHEAIRFVARDKELTSLSPKREAGTDDKIAKVEMVPQSPLEKKAHDSYEMPLDDFITMASELKKSEGVLEFGLREGFVWQKPREPGSSLSLKESYDHTEGNRRRYATISFTYANKCICLLEIDQKGLPGGCSTYVLISKWKVNKRTIERVMESFVDEKQSLTSLTPELEKQKIRLVKKHHPSGNGTEHLDAWRERVIKIILG